MQSFGAYLLLEPLGAGAMGDVHLARPLDPGLALPALVVIKRLHEQHNDNPTVVQRFQQEAQIAVRVDSPHVVKIFEAGAVASRLYLAMEFIPGWSFAQVSGRLPAGEERPIALLLAMGTEVAAGLVALHSAVEPSTGARLEVVHRDLSPRNLMLAEEGRSKIIDLGIGRSRLRAWKTRTGVLIGSPGYFSPEQAQGAEVSPASDVYTLGIVLWELLSGEAYVPVGPALEMVRAAATGVVRPLPAARARLPGPLPGLLRAMLDPSPAARPSAAEARAALQAMRADPHIEAAEREALLGAERPAQAAHRAHLLALQPWGTSHDATEIVTLARRPAPANPPPGALPRAPARAATAPRPPRRRRAARTAATLAAAAVAAGGVVAFGVWAPTAELLSPPAHPAPPADPAAPPRASPHQAPAAPVARRRPPDPGAREEAPPREGETPPREGETPPREGETPPREGETPPREAPSRDLAAADRATSTTREPAPTPRRPPAPPSTPPSAPPSNAPSAPRARTGAPEPLPDPLARVRALIQRAQALEPRLGGAARADLEELLAALLAERYRVAQPGAADRLANLERALVQLEAGAPKQSASSLPIGPD